MMGLRRFSKGFEPFDVGKILRDWLRALEKILSRINGQRENDPQLRNSMA